MEARIQKQLALILFLRITLLLSPLSPHYRFSQKIFQRLGFGIHNITFSFNKCFVFSRIFENVIYLTFYGIF